MSREGDWSFEHNTCTDCGCEPIWRLGRLLTGDPYCKWCHRKAGYSTTVELDLDKLDAALGENAADELIRKCRD